MADLVNHPRRTAAWLMVGASALFALMAVGVKLASAQYGAGEIVFWRSLVGALLMVALLRRSGVPLATPVPAMHFWRSLSGTTALCLWFYALGGLPLATAMTLNYMSSVWMAMFMIGGAVLLSPRRSPNGSMTTTPTPTIDGRLVAAVLAGFAGVALVLRPTLAQEQLWHGLCGLLSGMLAALAYLQVTALGRAGEPESRVVLYFSLGGMVAGGALMWASGGPATHTLRGIALLLGIGVLATAAQWMMTRAYGIGATMGVATLQYLGIVHSALLGVLLFDERLPAASWAGIALIIGAGIAATVLRQRAQGPAREAAGEPG